MFSLINGKPVFYTGKINGIGYTSDAEKELLIQELKKDNAEVEIKDEKIEIDEELKEKAEKLAELQLTYSKSEFMQYLNEEKINPSLKIKELEEENKQLTSANNVNLMALMEVNARLRELEREITSND